MNDNYISVKQYAKSKGISIQEAYAELDTAEMKPFVKIIDNIMMVKTAETQPTSSIEAKDNGTDRLQQEIDRLTALLEDKDKKIIELSNKLADMAIDSQKITENALNVVNQAQILQAVDKQKKHGFFRRLLEGRHE